MKKFLLVMTISLLSSASWGQTNSFPSTGNAEIKSGNLLIETNTWRSSLLTFKDTHYSPDQIYHFQIESDGLKIKQDGNVNYNFKSGGDFLVRNGKIGIGTLTPSATLDVIGTMRASTDANRFITIHSSSDGNSYINYNGGSSSSRLGFQIDGSSKMSIMNNGNVGIGTTSTGTHKLKVAGTIGSDKVYWGTSGANLTTSQGAAIELRGTGVPFIDFSNDASTDFDVRMILKNDDFLQIDGGSVGIGTSSSGTHKLAVEGSIGAREIKVEASGWSDFVFENDYELRTLEEVEEHINENGHLPEIPSEAEVTENGINLGELDAKLLQKIEELTLYMIDLNKQLQQLKSENQELKAKVNRLENE